MREPLRRVLVALLCPSALAGCANAGSDEIDLFDADKDVGAEVATDTGPAGADAPKDGAGDADGATADVGTDVGADAGKKPCKTSAECGTGTCCDGACTFVGTDPENCGVCGRRCAVDHAVAKCSGGGCTIGSCVAPWDDCNKNDTDGCEVDTSTDPKHCGACFSACTSSSGTPTCSASKCGVSCPTGLGDCDKDPKNGCEVDLTKDPKNCGGCGLTPAEVCNGKDDDCDGKPDDGFDCVLGSGPVACTTSCGTTGSRTCSATCTLSTCAPPGESCNLVDDDCNGKCDDLDGCRTAVHRFYKSSSGEHFYSVSASEGPGAGFAVEYSPYYHLYASAQPGTVAFHRCVLSSGFHFYTTSATCEGAPGSKLEGVMGYIATSATCGATALYRLVKGNDHFFTTSTSERSSAMGSGYADEGIAGYVWTASKG